MVHKRSILDFLEKNMFFSAKKFDFSEKKNANFANFLIECISNCIIAQENLKTLRNGFFLKKKIECSIKPS